MPASYHHNIIIYYQMVVDLFRGERDVQSRRVRLRQR